MFNSSSIGCPPVSSHPSISTVKVLTSSPSSSSLSNTCTPTGLSLTDPVISVYPSGISSPSSSSIGTKGATTSYKKPDDGASVGVGSTPTVTASVITSLTDVGSVY